MSKYFYFQALIKPTNFKINKGNIKLVREETDYSVKYPDSMKDHISINQVDKVVDIKLTKDFPNEDPMTINLSNLQTCNVNLESGTLRAEAVCPNMKVRVNSGTLSANISKHNMASVKAHVSNGVLNNNSDLQVDPSYEGQSFGSFWGMGTGFNNHIELMGNGSSHAVFELDTGTMDLFSQFSTL